MLCYLLQRETIAVSAGGGSEITGEFLDETPAHMLAYGKLRNLTPSRHLWVGCLSNVTKSRLLEIFSEFGEVEDIHFLKASD
jgi:hypothetical protein